MLGAVVRDGAEETNGYATSRGWGVLAETASGGGCAVFEPGDLL